MDNENTDKRNFWLYWNALGGFKSNACRTSSVSRWMAPKQQQEDKPAVEDSRSDNGVCDSPTDS